MRQVPDLPTQSFLANFRYGMACLLGVAALCIVVFTYRWPLIWDAQTFHYGNFLIAHGFVPYRDILERLWILEPIPGWLPTLNHLNR